MIVDRMRFGATGFLPWLLAACLQAGTLAAADEIAVEGAWIRETPPGVAVAGGYLVIRNRGGETLRFVGGAAEFAGAVEIHRMQMDGDIMRMRRVEDGLPIAPGGRVELVPGSYHLMFVRLRRRLGAGERVDVRLDFDRGRSLSVPFAVLAPGQPAPGQ